MLGITYYVACSVDGLIADQSGGVDWLSRAQVSGEDYGYADFVASIDAMIMGRRSYEQVLSFGDWPYGDTPCWVVSSRKLQQAGASVRPTSAEPQAVAADIRTSGCSHAWLVGGARLAGLFHQHRLITRYIVTVIPTILGSGIPLLSGTDRLADLELEQTIRYDSGVVQSHYSVGRR